MLFRLWSGWQQALAIVLGLGDAWHVEGYEMPGDCPVAASDHPSLGFLDSEFRDYDAMMGPCFESRTDGLLSQGDVAIAQAAYGRHATGSTVGDEGFCLVVDLSGTYPVIFPCRNDAAQQWSFNPENRSFWVPFSNEAGGDRCLGVAGDSVDPKKPTQAQAQPCDGRESQRVSLARTDWRALGVHCIDAVDGALLNLPCDVVEAQRWILFDTNDDATLWAALPLRLGRTALWVALRRGLP